MGRLRRSSIALVAALTLVCGAGAMSFARPAPADAAPAVSRHGLVVVYGDSLVAEALPYLNVLGAANGSIEVQSWGGTAFCDWFSDMFRTLPSTRPAVVVFAFSGNAVTSCMETPSGTPLQGVSYLAKYRRDAEAALAIAHASGAHSVIAATPRSKHDMNNAHWGELTRMYRDVAARQPHDVSFVDAGALIAPHEQYTPTMPCLPRERSLVGVDGAPLCRGGRIVVRAPDGGHFCPVGRPAKHGVTDGCPEYSSGAFRYAVALVHAARA